MFCDVTFAIVALVLFKLWGQYVQKFCLCMNFSLLCCVKVFVECMSFCDNVMRFSDCV